MNDFDKARRDANLRVAFKLMELVAEHPSQRFGQILRNYLYPHLDLPAELLLEEPSAVLKRLELDE